MQEASVVMRQETTALPWQSHVCRGLEYARAQPAADPAVLSGGQAKCPTDFAFLQKPATRKEDESAMHAWQEMHLVFLTR